MLWMSTPSAASIQGTDMIHNPADKKEFAADVAVCRVFCAAKRTGRMRWRAGWLQFILINLDLTPRLARRVFRRRFGEEITCLSLRWQSSSSDHLSQPSLALYTDRLELLPAEHLVASELALHPTASTWTSAAGYQAVPVDSLC